MSKLSLCHETTFMMPTSYEYNNNDQQKNQQDLQQEQERFLNYFKSNLPHRISHDSKRTTSFYLSPPLSVASSPPITSANKRQNTALKSASSLWNFTWLVFMNEKWVPFDMANQTKLEQTLTVGGTFVDITDTHFPAVKRVRVFPRNNYLSYLGVKYRLSRIMQPDAYLDHMSVAESKRKPSSSSLSLDHYH